jgi:hypothetical protein
MRAIVFAALFVSITLPALTQQISLDAMISKEEQARIGTSGMSPERLAALTNANKGSLLDDREVANRHSMPPRQSRPKSMESSTAGREKRSLN